MRGESWALKDLVTTDDSGRVSVLLGVLFGLAGMGSSSAAIALPLIADDFGVTSGHATWTISLYALMLAVTTAVYGRVSDLVGIRIPLLVGISLMARRRRRGAGARGSACCWLHGWCRAPGAAVPTLGVAVVSRATPAACAGSRWAGWPGSPPRSAASARWSAASSSTPSAGAR